MGSWTNTGDLKINDKLNVLNLNFVESTYQLEEQKTSFLCTVEAFHIHFTL